ncbi:MAG: hypothetical protein ACLTN0_21295 [Coprococcus phoceensis]
MDYLKAYREMISLRGLTVPYDKILFHLHPFLSGLSADDSGQTTRRCLLGGTPGVYPLAPERPFPL